MSVVHTNRRDFLCALGSGAAGFSFAYSAFGQTTQTPPIKATKLTDRIAVLSSDGGNVGVVVGDDSLMMIDGGYANRAAEMLKAVSDVDSHPVRVLFSTHWHYDHCGCNETVGMSGAKIIGHENTKKWLGQAVISEALNRAQSAAPDRAFGPLPAAGLPSEIFTKSGKMTFGTEKIEYTHVPLAHTDGDAYVFFPGANVLHTGDLLFHGIYPYIDYSTGGWIGGMVSACDALLKVVNSSTQIIPGHGPVASRDDLQASRDMLATVHERLEPMSKQGKSLEEVIALQPTKDLDAKWGKGLTAAQFLGMAYPSIAAHNKRV